MGYGRGDSADAEDDIGYSGQNVSVLDAYVESVFFISGCLMFLLTSMFDIDFEVLNAGDGGEWTQLYNTILRGLFRP